MEYSSESQAIVDSSAGIDDARLARRRSLNECGEIAETRLALALADALNQVVDQLFAKGVHGAFSPEQQPWLEAADFARTRRHDIVDAFKKHFEHGYAQACERKPGMIPGQLRSFDANQLTLVERNSLEYAINPEMLIESIRNGTWISLPELTKRFTEMLADPDLLPIDMPLGPRLLGNVTAHAINDQFCKSEPKLRMMRALCTTLPELVNRFYQDLSRHLAGMDASPGGLAASSISSYDTLPDRLADREDSTSSAVPNTQTEIEIAPASLAAAGEAITRQLASIKLPGFVAEFLSGPWQILLGKIHGECGHSSQDWKDALQTMDDLIKSLKTRKSPEAGLRLTRELPDLAKRLRRGLAKAGAPADKHDPFFKRLAEYHIRLLGKLGAVPITANHEEPAGATSRAIGTARASADSSPRDMSMASPHDAMEVGVWLEFCEPERPLRKLKIAWISPNRSLFLLTNHLGERALTLGPKDLAALLQEGGARIVSSPDATAAKDVAMPASQTPKTA